VIDMLMRSLLGRVAGGRVPGRARGDRPITGAAPVPISLLDNALLSSNEGTHWTHPVLLLGTTLDSRERCHTVIDNDANLRVRGGGAGKELELHVGSEWT